MAQAGHADPPSIGDLVKCTKPTYSRVVHRSLLLCDLSRSLFAVQTTQTLSGSVYSKNGVHVPRARLDRLQCNGIVRTYFVSTHLDGGLPEARWWRTVRIVIYSGWKSYPYIRKECDYVTPFTNRTARRISPPDFGIS